VPVGKYVSFYPAPDLSVKTSVKITLKGRYGFVGIISELYRALNRTYFQSGLGRLTSEYSSSFFAKRNNCLKFIDIRNIGFFLQRQPYHILIRISHLKIEAAVF
jgi:hypothetical protein